VIVAGEEPRRRRSEGTDEDLGAWRRKAGGGPSSAVGGGRPVGAGERERERESASGVKGRRKAAVKAVQCFLLYFSTRTKEGGSKKRWLK
jgi:hypothetical protein